MEERILLARRNSLVVLLTVIIFCEGWLIAVSMDQRMGLVLSVSASLTVTLLLITLSQLRGRPLIRSYHWLIYFVWPVFFPIYMIRTYKWKGLFILAGVIIACFLIVNTGYYTGLLLTR